MTHFARVPDGTLLSPFLNGSDTTSGLPLDLLESCSIAAGIIEPQSRSRVHLMPLVSQVTFVLQGRLRVRMKDPDTGSETSPAYVLTLTAEQAVLTRPGGFLQLINDSSELCQVLYIVSPAYLFDSASDGTLRYDDAIVLEQDWATLEAANWQCAALANSTAESMAAARSATIRRLRRSRQQGAELDARGRLAARPSGPNRG